jgi:WD40 repeat protein
MVWDAQSNQRRSALTGHRERITMLTAFDNLLVSASADGGLRLWDLATDSCVCVFPGHDGQTPRVLTCSMNEDRTLLATGDVQGDVKIWSVADW